MARAARKRREPLWVTALTAALLVTKVWHRAKHRPENPSKDKIERGWREVLKILYGHVSEHRLTAIAAGVTYFALLAIFPFVGAIVAVYGLFGDAAALGTYLDQLSSVLPGGAIEVIGDQLRRAAAGGRGTLSFAFVVSVVISLWSANAGVKALFDALNIVYDAKETRGFIALNAVSLAFTMGAAVFLLLGLALIVVLPNILGHIGLAAKPNGPSVSSDGLCFSPDLRLAWRLSIGLARAAKTRSGTGSLLAGRSPPYSGSYFRFFFLSTQRTLAATTKPMARSAL
jgi:hypothetical protein